MLVSVFTPADDVTIRITVCLAVSIIIIVTWVGRVCFATTIRCIAVGQGQINFTCDRTGVDPFRAIQPKVFRALR